MCRWPIQRSSSRRPLRPNTGSLGDGAVPVPVSLPLQGREVNFERLLALEEALTIRFKYRGLRR